MKTRFTFKYNHESDCANDIKIVCATDAVCLDDVLESFTHFLRGCGYYPKGELEFVEDENEQL